MPDCPNPNKCYVLFLYYTNELYMFFLCVLPVYDLQGKSQDFLIDPGSDGSYLHIGGIERCPSQQSCIYTEGWCSISAWTFIRKNLLLNFIGPGFPITPNALRRLLRHTLPKLFTSLGVVLNHVFKVFSAMSILTIPEDAKFMFLVVIL